MYYWLVVGYVSLSCARLGAAESPDVARNVQQGFLREGVVYVTAPPPKDKDAYVRLLQVNLRSTTEVGDGEKVRTFRDWLTSPASFPTLRWRPAVDGIWSHEGTFGFIPSSYLLPWEDLPWLDNASGEKGEAVLRKKYQIPPESEVIGWTHIVNIDYPAEAMALVLKIQREKEIKPSEFEVDFLPTAKYSFDLFVLFEKKLTIFHVKHKKDAKKGELAWEDTQGEVIPSSFQEPFLAYGKPEAPYFVTRTGKLYHVARPEKEKPKVVALWDDAKRPITAVLTDTNSGRSFALGVDQREGKDKQRFWLELVDKPEAVTIDAKEWPTVKVSEPLAPMLQFARYLDAKKKLTAP
jgi:hypothetical protein